MKKPFKAGAGGAIGDAGLSQAQKDRLRGELPADMTDDEKVNFLREVSIIIDISRKSQMFYGNNAVTKKRLQTFSNASHAMVSAIDGLRAGDEIDQDPFQELNIYFDDNLYASNPKIRLSNDLRKLKPKLEDLLDNLQVVLKQLEQVTDYTVEQIPTNKGDRLPDIKARQLAYDVTKAYKRMFNKMPPYNRASWFASFMSELGNVLEPKLMIGDKPLRYANHNLR